MLVKDDIVAESLELVAHAAALAVPRTRDGIRGHAGFGTVLHPGHAVALRIQERHSRPRREEDHQVVRYCLAVLVSVDDLEGLGEGQEMRIWMISGDPAHAVQVVAIQDVTGDVKAKETWLRLGNLCRDLREVRFRLVPGYQLIPAPRCAGAGVHANRLVGVTSVARARDALGTTSPRG